MAKKIGVIGSGIVGQTLANGFLKHGYTVMIGTNTAAKRDELRAKTSAQIGSFDDTAKFGDIIVLATKGSAAESAITAAGAANLRGKTVIDATNPIADAPPVNGVLKFFTSLDDSRSSINSGGTSPIWARSKPRVRSSRSASCGASRDSARTAGRTR